MALRLKSSNTNGSDRPPLGIRMLHALGKEPDWSRLTDQALADFQETQNRKRASRLARVITGFPDRGATITWEEVELSDRRLRVRVYRPGAKRSVPRDGDLELPLVVHVHGGGFVGTAAQSDWLNSRIAARLPALIVSVEHRLLGPGITLAAVMDDAWDVLNHVLEDAPRWGIDPSRTAVVGESTGAAAAAVAAIRARDAGLNLRAQVLINPCVDVTRATYSHDSVTRHADSPTLTLAQMRYFVELAVPTGSDALAVSPLQADDLGGLAPALVVVPTVDPVADHGRRYVERLLSAGSPAHVSEFRGATHAFLSMPGVVPQAKPARSEVVGFLRRHLSA